MVYLHWYKYTQQEGRHEERVTRYTTNLKDKIATATKADELATKIKDCLQKQLPLPMRTTLSDWSFTDGLILYKGRVYVPTNMELQKEVITSFHG